VDIRRRGGGGNTEIQILYPGWASRRVPKLNGASELSDTELGDGVDDIEINASGSIVTSRVSKIRHGIEGLRSSGGVDGIEINNPDRTSRRESAQRC